MRLLIGITGQMGSGKTTVAKYLVEKYSFQRMQISGKMREIAQELGLKPTREFLQGIGKFMREIDDDVWIRYLVKEVNLNKSKSIVVDDIRRKNEIDFLSPLGFKFIRIDSPSIKRKERIENRDNQKISKEDWLKWSDHLTEIQVAALDVNYVLENNGTIRSLLKKIDEIICELQSSKSHY
ncbi:MAG: AAA family ATPase [Candidatus Hodarchaeota archaeon]